MTEGIKFQIERSGLESWPGRGREGLCSWERRFCLTVRILHGRVGLVGVHHLRWITPRTGDVAALVTYIWLAPWAGKINQILRCDWLHERARWSYLARSGLPVVSRKKNFQIHKLLAMFKFYISWPNCFYTANLIAHSLRVEEGEINFARLAWQQESRVEINLTLLCQDIGFCV